MASTFVAPRCGAATAEDLLAAGDLGPCELVQGEIVMMSPAGFEHGVLTQRVAAILHAFVSERGLGVVTAAETGFLLSRSPDTVRAPDAAFVAAARVPRGRTVGYFEGIPIWLSRCCRPRIFTTLPPVPVPRQSSRHGSTLAAARHGPSIHPAERSACIVRPPRSRSSADPTRSRRQC